MANNLTSMEINQEDVKRCIREAISYVYWDCSPEERALLLQNTWVKTADSIRIIAGKIHEDEYSEVMIRKILIELFFAARLSESTVD